MLSKKFLAFLIFSFPIKNLPSKSFHFKIVKSGTNSIQILELCNSYIKFQILFDLIRYFLKTYKFVDFFNFAKILAKNAEFHIFFINLFNKSISVFLLLWKKKIIKLSTKNLRKIGFFFKTEYKKNRNVRK